MTPEQISRLTKIVEELQDIIKEGKHDEPSDNSPIDISHARVFVPR